MGRTRRLSHYRPLSHNTVYMPSTAINAKENLDSKSLLVRVIGVAREEAKVAGFIKNIWKPRGTFRMTRVNHQSFKVGFYSEREYTPKLKQRNGITSVMI